MDYNVLLKFTQFFKLKNMNIKCESFNCEVLCLLGLSYKV